ncbi:MAG: YlmH/Sll1252 family protein [Defluviitaleaceae bacterium]|nr:YlmH/Sll1252 family protein [Defluviitaleaceae bacterium]
MHMDNPFKETEDRLQFAKALDRFKAAQNRSHATFTDFMNPQRSVVFLQQFTKMKIEAQLYGGYEDAERKMIGFTSYEPLLDDNFPIIPLAISYNGRFSRQLTHRDFLGSVLGLGLDRGKIGDIRIGDSGAVMYVAHEVADFITESLCEVGRTSVTASRSTEVSGIETPGTQKRITVSSMRLDTVISTALHLSRGKAASLIEAEKVFVNWAIGKKTMQLSTDDIITVRKVGRIKIEQVIGTTKKDRIALVITVF